MIEKSFLHINLVRIQAAISLDNKELDKASDNYKGKKWIAEELNSEIEDTEMQNWEELKQPLCRTKRLNATPTKKSSRNDKQEPFTHISLPFDDDAQPRVTTSSSICKDIDKNNTLNYDCNYVTLENEMIINELEQNYII